ncbi:MAG: hypothetical protein IJI25_12275 [Eubacterium sp.]|nr:hypothetical protein [Eubacterium sp.]
MSKYDQIMDRIELSEEAKKRILKSTSKAAEQYSGRTAGKHGIMKGLAMVACFVLLITGSVCVQYFIKPKSDLKQMAAEEDRYVENEDLEGAGANGLKAEGVNPPEAEEAGNPEAEEADNPEEEAENAAPARTEMASAEDLSKKLGFEISDLSQLKARSLDTGYYAYDQGMGEILYHMEDGVICYRKSRGKEDNSGVYTDYPWKTEIKNKKEIITLKGQDGLYELAVWQSEGFSSSLYLEKGKEIEWWEELF